ncbi:3-oxoadipyl-CoA thiolase [Sulfitobacter sp. PR48]|uniref:3-oxoadipyl-CoA thiolase n=1 Tax=Sulfitobacter sp. PR48 TaxID=3028383 RepID=UPI00237BF2F2|nr:3-oxoadipyl-CoA thiolase [Sulfitobacter sp. PR48]MDD9722798.1 3-oxoadipyl-CoA thiolase [Sulfitobacter sp. PR48]
MIDVFLCDYIRTPFGRYAGSLSPVRADDLAAIPIRELMLRNPDADWAAVDDVYYGCVNQAGEDNRNVARMAALLAGLPVEVPGATINRLCGSGMNAVMSAVRAIAAGEAELMIAGGVESMSRAPFVMPKAGAAFTRRAEIYDTTIGSRFENPAFANIYGYEAMPVTAENVAADFGVSRADQDAFALRSQTRAAAAQTTGRLSREIVGVAVPQRRGGPVTVDQDEHIRPDTTLDSLAKLRAPFVENGTVTAGNASGVNDGAAAMILASESAVRKHVLIPRARYLGGAVAGVPPRIMGMGPVPATQKLCARIGLSPTEFEVIELNEAFAAQGLAVLRELGLPDDAEHINPNGGAIALGHPLGASGARITGTAVLELQERGGKRALATMCIGVGQGIAIAVEAV